MADTIVNTRVGAMTYLAPSGQLSGDGPVAELQAAVVSCIAAHQVQLVLDLATVQLVSGKALEVMLDSQARLGALGGGLKLLNPNSLVRDIFRATGFSGHVEGERAAPAQRPGAGRKLGDILLESGAITAERLQEAAALQKQLGQRLGRILVDKGFVSEADLLKALSHQLDVSYVTLRPGLYDPAALALLDKSVARRLEVLPMFRVRDTLTIAMADPQSLPKIDRLRQLTGLKIRPVLALGSNIREFISKYK
ncbi:MAG TPA: STAS domain-containing protein, partial [Burkholderiales bacterium]|nr:STAS domain-containing protein [Burkholderiales bacterium]